MDIYKTMLFEKNIGAVRKATGAISQYLCESLSIINGTYVKRDYGYWDSRDQIKNLDKIPTNFLKFYDEIFKAKDIDAIFKLTHKLIEETRDFFNDCMPYEKAKNYNYDELAGWYEEARYTFRRIEYACENNKYVECFNLGCYLQVEFDILTEDLGLDKMDLLGVYDADDLTIFEERAKEIEAYILTVIEENGVSLRKYDDLEQFLKYEG